jgi:type I restriction enzyme M protein
VTPRPAKTDERTPEARLASVIKTARDTMRKDAGLNGDLDRIPQIAWLLFLKAFDDLEDRRAVLDESYKAVLPERFRWRVWAGDREKRLTGARLLEFVNEKLLPHLASLQGSGQAGDPAETLGEVFRETRNRMVSGYLLYDLVDQINRISFTSSDDVHTMARLYETMLREMRDAAGDSGEFYTPRPVIRFMVGRVDPQIGEKVLDPAVGTGGFLVEAYEHLRRQVRTAKDQRTVETSLQGFEKKPLPYLLCQMNLLLHGVAKPQVRRANALALELADHRRNGVDVVLTNPPFGGEEESQVQKFFKADLRTAETSWLFLQAVMARLSRSRTGRCGIIVPNSVLFNEGVGARIKAKLLKDFNLHTVVRLPNGVFSPYTLIPSNLLFFERGTTQDVWFYEHPLPEGRKNYTKTKPLRYEEFADCEQWWGDSDRAGRAENERAWKVSLQEIVDDGYNLDLRNPHRADDLAHRPPAELVAELIETEREMLKLLEELQSEIAEARS